MKRWSERFLFGFTGTGITPSLEEMILEWKVGGVILFARNVVDAGQVASLCNEIQLLRSRVSRSPLFIAVDHEGGAVNRLRMEGVTHFPSAMAVAATGNPDYARRMGLCMGSELLRLGITMNLAPVCDLCVNRENPTTGIRTFGSDPATVARFAVAMVEGMREAGIPAVAKHFPGLGFAARDAHREMPRIAKEKDELEREDLLPFRRVINAGIEGVMVCHARYPALSARPASISPKIAGKLLREEMGFGGLTMTDDLGMGAIIQRRSIGDAAVKACVAGIDLLLIGNDRHGRRRAVMDVARALRSGELKGMRESVRRIAAFKERFASVRKMTCEEGSGGALAREIAEAGLTVMCDRNGILPLRLSGEATLLMVLPQIGPLTAVEDAPDLSDMVISPVRKRWARTRAVDYGVTPSPRDFEAVRGCVEEAAVVIMGTCNAHASHGQQELLRIVAASGKPLVCVALRTPFDNECYPAEAARLATYGSDPCMMEALVKTLFGECVPRGRMPV